MRQILCDSCGCAEDLGLGNANMAIHIEGYLLLDPKHARFSMDFCSSSCFWQWAAKIRPEDKAVDA